MKGIIYGLPLNKTLDSIDNLLVKAITQTYFGRDVLEPYGALEKNEIEFEFDSFVMSNRALPCFLPRYIPFPVDMQVPAQSLFRVRQRTESLASSVSVEYDNRWAVHCETTYELTPKIPIPYFLVWRHRFQEGDRTSEAVAELPGALDFRFTRMFSIVLDWNIPNAAHPDGPWWSVGRDDGRTTVQLRDSAGWLYANRPLKMAHFFPDPSISGNVTGLARESLHMPVAPIHIGKIAYTDIDLVNPLPAPEGTNTVFEKYIYLIAIGILSQS